MNDLPRAEVAVEVLAVYSRLPCAVKDCGFVGCGRHDPRTSLESALLLSLSSQLRPLHHYIPHSL